MMKVIYISSKQRLDAFVGSQAQSQFLQSYDWGEFQEKVADKAWRLGVIVDDELVATATIIKKALPMGKSYFYCPRGPVIIKSEKLKAERILNFLFKEIENIAAQEGAMFLRFEPTFNFELSTFNLRQTLDVQPSKTLIMDLRQSADESLKQMHSKTRYNIKLAEKKGVEIIEAGIDRFDEFWRLICETRDRDEFRTHGIDYYKEMLKPDRHSIKLLFAQYLNNIIGTGIFSLFGDMVSYLHGGSANCDRQVMAPYLMHWYVIKLAKAKGYKYYDLNGIDEKKWPGVTRFKLGFNGQEKDDEVFGSTGTSYTAEFWQYDSRTGRRWNLDPKPNPSISQYATFALNPIMYSDPLGDTLRVKQNSQSTTDITSLVKNDNTQYLQFNNDMSVSLDFGNLNTEERALLLSNDEGLS